MLLPPIDAILASAQSWGGWGHQNSQLELASLVLESRVAGLDIAPLQALYDKQITATRVRPGVFKRSPDSTMANSKDNILGLAILSYLYDGGAVARDILDQGPFYFSGKNEHGAMLDGEWFMLFNPVNRATLKLAAGRRLSFLEDWAMRRNLIHSKVWNTKRVRILFLCELGYTHEDLAIAALKMSRRYRGRYGSDPIYAALWELNEGAYYVRK